MKSGESYIMLHGYSTSNPVPVFTAIALPLASPSEARLTGGAVTSALPSNPPPGHCLTLLYPKPTSMANFERTFILTDILRSCDMENNTVGFVCVRMDGEERETIYYITKVDLSHVGPYASGTKAPNRSLELFGRRNTSWNSVGVSRSNVTKKRSSDPLNS